MTEHYKASTKGVEPFTEEEEAQWEIDQAAELARQPAVLREAAKLARTNAVDLITVTVGTKKFDGDETSQARMSRAIIGLQAAGAQAINWTLANNTVTQVTVAELTEALILAGQRQAELWTLE